METIILFIAILISMFLIVTSIFRFVYVKIKNNQNRLLNPEEYLPEDELHTLRQIYYLIMMALLFLNIMYIFVVTSKTDITFLAIFDIVLSLYLAISLDKISLKNAVIFLMLVPYGSLTFLFSGDVLISIFDIIHIPVFIYFIKVYYDKFREYTESNGLGIAIILLFILVFTSFLVTQVAEGVNALDALVMVSNSFTSNGYAVLGSSIPGKINAIILVWGGYILSGVGTATLASAILIRHFNKKFEELEEMIKNNNED